MKIIVQNSENAMYIICYPLLRNSQNEAAKKHLLKYKSSKPFLWKALFLMAFLEQKYFVWTNV